MRRTSTIMAVTCLLGLSIAACTEAAGDVDASQAVDTTVTSTPPRTDAPSMADTSTTTTATNTTVTPTTAASTTVPPPEFPRFAPSEYGALIDASAPAGTTVPSPPPSITGHQGADERIRSLAEARGYRLRPVSQVRLVAEAGVLVHPDLVTDLRYLLADAHGRGMVLELTSGHRSPARQREIFERELGEESQRLRGRLVSHEEIATGSADDVVGSVLAYHSIPGYSRHHSGFTIDFDAGGALADFEHSPAEQWLRADDFANAKRYGFVPSYPRGSAPQGPQPEPWEFVWVGSGNIRCAALHVPMQDPDAAASCPLVE